jgi:hypothetical protein
VDVETARAAILEYVETGKRPTITAWTDDPGPG